MTAAAIDWDSIVLAKGSHTDPGCGKTPEACFWEALNLDRQQRLTDRCPDDVNKTLHAYTLRLNDALPDDRRQKLKGYRDRPLGTAGQPGADERAPYLAVDWLIRTYTPAWLRLAGLDVHADALAGAGEITDMTGIGRVSDVCAAARTDADAAWSAAWSAADSAAAQKLARTVTALRDSAFDLLDRMLDCYTVQAAA